MLQLFFFYFGAAMIKMSDGSSLALTPFAASVIAFVLNYSAYFAEIFRGGIIGVNKGQYEASKALGLTGVQTMRYVVVPQMIRTVIPPIANETIVLVKDTALASSIALIDLLKAAQRAVNRDMKISPLLAAAIVYLAITLILTFIFGRIEKRLSISEQGVK
jgi:polar amino acid transport system permease protein